MNKNLLILGSAVAVVVVAIAAIVAVSAGRAPEKAAMVPQEGSASSGSAPTSTAAAQDNNTAAPGGESAMTKNGSYEAYSTGKLALAREGKVVLFFRASWCPTCKVLDANIRSNVGNIPEGTVILDVNYDDSEELKRKYNVTYQHTLVQVDASGAQIAKWSGSPSLADVLARLK